ncbi:MAG TPA: HEXXH motif-containing putative peptide modification protein [Nitrospiraceae bacterium]|nr:HEXXH motif-containing putative peptide modification protein [Nitrospiraceae bacterium]
MKLVDPSFLASLLREFRRSMRRFIPELCDELEQRYAPATRRLMVPVDLIRLIGQAMPLETYSQWRFVGWIESLNDLVYFVDLAEQAKRARHDPEFLDQLYAECQRSWYEHGYADELFPDGVVYDGRLPDRLHDLCRRLAREVTQQAFLWDPALTCKWVLTTSRRSWQTVCGLAPNFDHADPPYALSVGVDEVLYHAPRSVRRRLQSATADPLLIVTARGIFVSCEGVRYPLYTAAPARQWHWRRQDPVILRKSGFGTLTLGSTLVYGRAGGPTRVSPTVPAIADRIGRALSVIEQAWPAGSECLALLTSRIVPLKAPGVVSFSYRHQPGLSFINCFDRNDLDLIDDLIHENSHHHLNLLLRKDVLYHGDCNREIFYSPWRRTLRPIRGILHASFTFAMGAFLFERLSAWASGPEGRRRWQAAGLSKGDLERARFRGLEEIESVRYALRDLREAQRRFGWITEAGGRLVQLLSSALSRTRRRMGTPTHVLRPSYRARFIRHVNHLKAARRRYRLGVRRSR